MENLREDWVEVELGTVCFTTSGGTPSRRNNEFYNGSIPWVKSGELDKGIIYNTEEKISDEAIKKSSAKVFPKDTLLIALYGATIGKLAFLGVDAATNQAICGIYKSQALESKYLYHFLLNRRQKLISQGTGGAQPNISQTILKKLVVPLPPLTIQRTIVAKIENLFTSLDKGIADLEKAQQQLKVYRQAVLKKAFEGGLTSTNNINTENSLPDGWNWVKLGEITTILGDGLHGTPKYSDKDDFYFINGNNLVDGKIVIKENTKMVSHSEYEKYKKPLNEKTIFVSINGTLGNVAFYNEEKVILGKSACFFNVNDNIDKNYIRYCIVSHRFIAYAEETATGSTIKNVGLKAMREFKIPLPKTLSEQHQIVREIETRLSVCDKVEQSITESLETSKALRQSILKKAFEGKLLSDEEIAQCRQAADYEPAGELLKKIQATKK
jgi:type I restriction enzyme S subunit